MRQGSSLTLLWPFVFGVAAAEFPAELWIQALPEAGEVCGGLDGALVGGEQVDHQSDLPVLDARCFAEAEEILQSRCDPGRLVRVVVDARLAAVG